MSSKPTQLGKQHITKSGYNYGPLWATASGADPEEIVSRIFHLSDAGLILITANFPVTTKQYPTSL